MSESYADLLVDVVRQNEDFFKSTKTRENYLREIVDLTMDSIDLVPKSKDMSDPKLAFWIHAMQPLSNGIFTSLVSGNILACFMQLRLLLEYLALNSAAEKIPGDNLLEKYKTVRSDYGDKYISDLLRDFDVKALKLWKKISKWHHAITYSKRIEKTTADEGAKLWSLMQPAFYSKEDERELKELHNSVSLFRTILKKHISF
ncbi:MAG: hypothetical protein ACW9W3_01050 [Candidatus Nitrosopumilus sp. bin_68KS]